MYYSTDLFVSFLLISYVPFSSLNKGDDRIRKKKFIDATLGLLVILSNARIWSTQTSV